MTKSKQRFLFTNNSLSKTGFVRGMFQILLFRSKKNQKAALDLLSEFFKVNKDQVFLFGAGRMSVYLLIRSIKLKPNDEVIVAGYTCVVLTNAIKFTGCRIKYVDINRSTMNLDTNNLLTSVSDSTKVLIVPHNFGIPYNDISVIKSKFPELIIVEDVAHSFGSSSDNNKICGTIGDAGFFSLEYSKPLTSGMGGVMIINNNDLLKNFREEYERLTSMKGMVVFKIIATLGVYNLSYFKNTTFFQTNCLRALRVFKLQYGTSAKEIEGDIPDNYPVRMNSKLTCFLRQQMNSISKVNSIKREIVQSYNEAFKDSVDITIIKANNAVLVRYPIVFNENVELTTVQFIKDEGIKRGINFGVWFNDVVHPAGSFRYGYNEGDCPNGEFVAKRILNLPVNANYPDMREEVSEVISIFRKYGIK